MVRTADQLSDQSTGAKSLLENIQGTLDDRLISELKTARERLVAASNTLETLRNTIEGLGSFLPVDLTGPDQILVDLIDSANSLDSEASIFLSDSSFILGGDLSETRKSLEAFLATVQEYEERVTEWRKQVADLIDFERAARFGFSILIHGLGDSQVGVLHGFDLFTVAALSTRHAGLAGGRAVQGLGESQRQGTPADAGRSREEIRMAHGAKDDMFLQHVYGPFVSDQVPV